MKSFIFISAILKAAEVVSARDLVAMEAPADTWCVTYLSTYIAAVTNQGNEAPSAQNSGRLPFQPSLRPTFARNTSISVTRSALSTDIGPESSLFTSDVISTADTPPFDSESSDSDVDPTAVQSSSATLTVTDSLSTVATPTTDTAATSTPTDIIEPAGRNVIFLIQTTSNQKRSFYKRANNEFVGDSNPQVCTFADTFNLVEGEGQLFASGFPIYYSGEDYKELSSQGRPPSGSVTSGFTDTGGSLAFRNPELPSGEAGFCQDADGQVYITFTTGPSGCTPVSLGIYNVEQCQNGKLVGVDELTSSGPGTVTATAERSLSTESTSGELTESTGFVPSESNSSASQTSEFEVSVTVSESSTLGRSDTSSEETSASTVTEDVETLSSVSGTSGDPDSQPPTASTSQLVTETSDLLDSTTTYNDGIGISTTSIVGSQTETTETTGVDTLSTEVVNDVDTTTTGTTDTTTTNADTTTLPENPTTTEAKTTTEEITTTAEPTTTTAPPPEPTPQFACGNDGFTTTYTYNGVTFNLGCGRLASYSPLDDARTASYGECLRRCALNSACNGIIWDPAVSFCALASLVNDVGPYPAYDIAQVASRS
ncbi:hypothetical protein NW768_011726 [Fusarium equiseti]|uniref:DUF7908 domain-containing protein n=1 Tax=Fusarium equiseti TaxID=61235 RepID=A0ABQ8QWT3_FUSEQ|nr:hypothetical protein NW768_011726 [Fusarium equiseti]